MTEYSENRTIITTENGKKKYQFHAPLLEGYTAGKNPYREFRKGIRMITFTSDSLEQVDVTLTANYAIYYEDRKLWEAKGNVVVVKADGKRLYTEQLFWNALTKKIYSNVDAKIVEPDGETFVSGFESDEEFRYWRAREMDGHMQVEFKPEEPVETTDSTALATDGDVSRQTREAVSEGNSASAEPSSTPAKLPAAAPARPNRPAQSTTRRQERPVMSARKSESRLPKGRTLNATETSRGAKRVEEEKALPMRRTNEGLQPEGMKVAPVQAATENPSES